VNNAATRFQPGRSGNPSGRKKVSEDVKQFAKAHSIEAIKCVLDVMRQTDDDRVKLAAAQTILDRGYGRPQVQADPDDVKGGVTIQIVQMPATQAPAKVIEHDGANHHPVAEQVVAPTVSVRPLELSAIRGQAGGSGLPS
jgi:hypothetical protein